MSERYEMVKVEGLRALLAAMRAEGRELPHFLKAGRTAAIMARNATKPVTPVGTGRATDAKHPGVLASTTRSFGGMYGAALLFGKKGYVEYARAIHWGWKAHNIEAQPYGVIGIQRAMPHILREYQKALEKTAEEIGDRARRVQIGGKD